MSPGQKALKACADYARLNAEIRRLTQAIGDNLAQCKGAEVPRSVSIGGLAVAISAAQSDETHLKQAYTPGTESDTFDIWTVYMDDAEIREYLAVCLHCLAAHQAIQDRKAARRSLGAAKRVITMLGNKVAK